MHFIAAAAALSVLALPAPAPGLSPTSWTTAWGTAPAAAVGGVQQGYAGFTIRNVVHTTVGGNKVRIHLSNRYGTKPVLFGHVTVAVSAHRGGQWDGTIDQSDGAAAPGTMREVLFGGSASFTVPAGADAISDPVALKVGADRDLLVSVWTPEPSGTVTYHPAAMQDSVFSRGPADHAGDESAAAFGERTQVWHYLSGVDVSGGPGTVVALGDSITDGVTSTFNANRRWTDYLARRLANGPQPDYGIANSGISGNRVLLDCGYPNWTIYQGCGESAQNRLPSDVLLRAGVRSVIIFEGVNDIQQDPHQTDPAKIIAGLEQITTQARDQGLRVVGATIMPFRGWSTWTPELEATRVAVNEWIRTTFAGSLADFDATTRDPADPSRMLPAYDSGDHLHPNDAGDLAMARVVPLGRL
ncbi:SGNH/GDSL hydrolase family protein [Actinoplanes sp. NPDC089786]|uniref:SGNH/GDSL hydrolase family protein n=1 Tax=Actinoplanes sp. NPDC089786 TaxID=3155185 RepID=UPI003435664A